MKTLEVLWPDEFGEDVVTINESDFDSSIHELVDGGGKGSVEEAVYAEIQSMSEADPDKANDDWWRKDGYPELKELRNRLPDISVTDALRSDQYERYEAGNT